MSKCTNLLSQAKVMPTEVSSLDGKVTMKRLLLISITILALLSITSDRSARACVFAGIQAECDTGDQSACDEMCGFGDEDDCSDDGGGFDDQDPRPPDDPIPDPGPGDPSGNSGVTCEDFQGQVCDDPCNPQSCTEQYQCADGSIIEFPY